MSIHIDDGRRTKDIRYEVGEKSSVGNSREGHRVPNGLHRNLVAIGTHTRFLAALALSILILACQNTALETLTPVPSRVQEIYRALQEENVNNVARLRTMEDDRESFRFVGDITTIEEKEIRFYVESPLTLAEDRYVECNFTSNRKITSVDIGDEVTVKGELARAFRGRLFLFGETRAVIFEDCEIES